MKSSFLIILEALMIGQIIEMRDGFVYGMSEDNELCVRMIEYRKDLPGEEIWIKQDITLGGFMKMCNKFSEGELFIISSQTALMKMGQDSVRRREESRIKKE